MYYFYVPLENSRGIHFGVSAFIQSLNSWYNNTIRDLYFDDIYNSTRILNHCSAISFKFKYVMQIISNTKMLN